MGLQGRGMRRDMGFGWNKGAGEENVGKGSGEEEVVAGVDACSGGGGEGKGSGEEMVREGVGPYAKFFFKF